MFSISLLIFNQYATQKDADNLWLANQQQEKDLEVKEQDLEVIRQELDKVSPVFKIWYKLCKNTDISTLTITTLLNFHKI